MLTLPPSTRIFIAREPIDMRRSFDGLSVAVRSMMQQDPMSGYMFIFLNKTRSLVKDLVETSPRSRPGTASTDRRALRKWARGWAMSGHLPDGDYSD